MQSLANSGAFWGLLIAGIIAVYLLPTIIGLIRGVDRLGLVVLLNLLGWMVWPAALILAFGPRRLPPSAPPVVYSSPVVCTRTHGLSTGRPITPYRARGIRRSGRSNGPPARSPMRLPCEDLGSCRPRRIRRVRAAMLRGAADVQAEGDRV